MNHRDRTIIAFPPIEGSFNYQLIFLDKFPLYKKILYND